MSGLYTGLLIMGSRVRVPPGSPLVLIDKSGPAPCVFGGAGTGSVSTGKTSDIYRSRAQLTRSSILGPLGIRDLATFEIERVTGELGGGGMDSHPRFRLGCTANSHLRSSRSLISAFSPFSCSFSISNRSRWRRNSFASPSATSRWRRNASRSLSALFALI